MSRYQKPFRDRSIPMNNTTPESPGLRLLKPYLDPAPDEDTETAARAVTLRILGHHVRDIAAELHVAQRQVLRWLRAARENAELRDVGPVLDHVAMPLAIDNLVRGLEAGDQKLTLATLNGRGAFSKHSKSETTNQDVKLEIHVDMPDRVGAPLDVLDGQVVGVPRQVADKGDG